MKKIKITAIDKVFSRLVRIRDGWTCQRCGSVVQGGGLDCSHLWGRSRTLTRWWPKNAVAHCMGCHSYLGGNPVEFARWITAYLGEDEADALERMARSITKISTADKRDILDHYRAELKRVEVEGGGFVAPDVLVRKAGEVC